MSELTHTVLRADGLSCPSCVAKIESKLNGMGGVSSAEVKFASGRILVEHDASAVSVHDLVDAITQMGYSAKPSAV